MAKFCQNCGSALTEGTKFCPSCGTPVAQSAQPTQQQPSQQPQQQPKPYTPKPYTPKPQVIIPEEFAQRNAARAQRNAARTQQKAAPVKKQKGKGGLTAVVSLVLVAAIVLGVFGFRDGGWFRGSGKQVATAELSPDATSATTGGITVDVGPYVLDGDEELRVTRQVTEYHKEEGYKIESYDIAIGDLHELDDFITIRIPYDTTFCEPGQDPSRCVGAKYKNEATGQWEDVLFEVDAEANELVIYTDHLSVYGAFYVENEGKRSAYISDVLGYESYMDNDQAYDFAKRIAENDASVRGDLAKYEAEACDLFYDYADRIDNAINIATLGDVPDWLDTTIPDTNLTLFSALGYISTCKNLMTIAAQDTLGGGASKEDVLNLMRDVSTKVATYWADAFTTVGSGALSVGMGGVLIIDKYLTAFAEEAQATRLEDIGYVYYHFNESFSGFGHKVMTPKDWRAKVIEIIEKNPDDPDVAIYALEAGFRSYAAEFFSLTGDQMYEVASDTPNVTVKRIPNFTEDEKNQMIEDYVTHLKNNTMPAVLTSVRNYMIKKVELQQLEALNKVKEYYNTPISITLREDISEGGSSEYKGYKFCFAPLNDRAIKGNWRGIWPENGKVSTNATLLGFVMAGYPHTVEFFEPDADMDNDEPAFTVPFVISTPNIDIVIAGKDENQPADNSQQTEDDNNAESENQESGTDEPKEGYWRLKETNVTPREDEIGEGGFASWYYSASELSHTTRISRPETDYHGAGGATLTVTCSAPPQIIRPSEEVVMHLSVDGSYSGDYMTWVPSGSVQYGAPNDERNAIAYNNGTRFAALEEGGKEYVELNPFANDNILETTVVHVFDKGTRAGSEMAILFYSNAANTLWIYEWVE